MQKSDGILCCLIWREETQTEKYHKKLSIYYSMQNYAKQTEKHDFNSFYWTGKWWRVWGFVILIKKSRASQVWYLLIEYLGYIQQKGFNLVKVLSFILQLGFCSLGTDYVCDNDDTEMSQVIQHFRELGLVFKRKGSSKENVIIFQARWISFHTFIPPEDPSFWYCKAFLSNKTIIININMWQRKRIWN